MFICGMEKENAGYANVLGTRNTVPEETRKDTGKVASPKAGERR